MTITGGSTPYYRCADNKKRGASSCANALTVREEEVRVRILAAIRDELTRPSALTYLRKRVAEKLGELSRSATKELDERRGRLARTEERIAGLIEFIAQGDRSEYVRKALADLEHQATEDKRAIEAVSARTRAPVRLPSPQRRGGRRAEHRPCARGRTGARSRSASSALSRRTYPTPPAGGPLLPCPGGVLSARGPRKHQRPRSQRIGGVVAV
jgi:hypothetical protein